MNTVEVGLNCSYGNVLMVLSTQIVMFLIVTTYIERDKIDVPCIWVLILINKYCVRS